jgi:hypothetical protein
MGQSFPSEGRSVHFDSVGTNPASGFPMAQNLRSNIASTDQLLINDVNAKATRAFVEVEKSKSGAPVEEVLDPHVLADRSVGLNSLSLLLALLSRCDEYVLSMI